MESLGIGFGGDHQTGTGVQDGLTGCRYGVSVDVDCAQVDLPVSVGAADRDSLRRGRIELGRIDITKHQLAVVLSVGYRSVWNGPSIDPRTSSTEGDPQYSLLDLALLFESIDGGQRSLIGESLRVRVRK